MTTTLAAVRRGQATALHKAVASGDVDGVARLIAGGADLEAHDAEGHTPLHTACRHAEPEAFGLLLDAGADIEATNVRGMGPLFLAACGGTASFVRVLLDRGADANRVAARGLTPLVGALMSENAAVVRLLVAAGADVRHRDADGTSMLRWAKRVGTPEMVDLVRHPDRSDETLTGSPHWHDLHRGARTGDVELVSNCLAIGVPVDTADDGGVTALMLAARHGKRATVAALLAAGADPHRCSAGGLSAAMMAANDPVVLRPFVHAGVDLDRGCDRRGTTPLIHAARLGFEDVVTMLLSAGADPLCADAEGKTALDHAVANGHRSVARALFVAGGTA